MEVAGGKEVDLAELVERAEVAVYFCSDPSYFCYSCYFKHLQRCILQSAL